MYHKLVITAAHPKREIWLADNERNLVQRSVGILETSVLPGDYLIRFGCLSSEEEREYPLKLTEDTTYHEEGDP